MDIQPPLQGQQLLDLVQESVIVSDPDGKIVSWNRAAEALYGWNRQDAVGRSLALLGDQTTLEKAQASRAFSETDRWVGELHRRTSTGESIVASTRLQLRRDERGVPIDLVEFTSKVTTAKHAEQALRLSEQRYRDLFHEMPFAYWKLDLNGPMKMLAELRETGVTDLRAYLLAHPEYVRSVMRTGVVLDLNQRAVELFELEPSRTLPAGFETTWPEGTYLDFIDATLAGISGERTFTVETRQRTLGGREFDVLFTASFPADFVSHGAFIVNILDISDVKRGQAALRQREDFYRNLFDASAISVWLLDKNPILPLLEQLRAEGVTSIADYGKENPGFSQHLQSLYRVLDVNETTMRLFGDADRTPIIGGGIERFWIPGQDGAFVGAANAGFHNEPGYRIKTRMRALDGRELDVLFTTSTSERLRASGLSFVVVVDLIDQVHAEAALADMQASYAHSARVSLLGELTATIAHEINQPLAAITTNGQAGLRWLNRSDPDVDELRQLTKDMISDAQRASDIIVSIRAMASPKAEPRHPISLNDLVCKSLLFLRPQLEDANIEPHCELRAGLPVVLADAIQIQQVLVNVILNAIHALGNTANAELQIRTACVMETKVSLMLTDNGPGIMPEHFAKIFESFFTTKSTGMGIGLAICRTIIEAHGGTIDIQNADPCGARVTLILPADAAASEPPLAQIAQHKVATTISSHAVLSEAGR